MKGRRHFQVDLSLLAGENLVSFLQNCVTPSGVSNDTFAMSYVVVNVPENGIMSWSVYEEEIVAKSGKNANTKKIILNKSNNMENKKSNTKTTSGNGKQSKIKSTNVPMESSQLMKLFEDELKDLYWAEKAVTKAIPKMIKNATSRELIEGLKSHLGETDTQVSRLEQVFKSIDKTPVAKKCEAMAGIIKEGEDLMESSEKGAMRDAGIISASQKVEHYEIASYGTLRQFAETLGLTKAVLLLEATLNEEKAADVKLSEVATYAVNIEAAQVEA